MVVSGTHYSSTCCFDYGNAEKDVRSQHPPQPIHTLRPEPFTFLTLIQHGALWSNTHKSEVPNITKPHNISPFSLPLRSRPPPQEKDDGTGSMEAVYWGNASNNAQGGMNHGM